MTGNRTIGWKAVCGVALWGLWQIPSARCATTIDSLDAFAYGANIGWINAAGYKGTGAEIGEFYCSGPIHGANVGWISLGDGSPENGHTYGNNSAEDYGVNVSAYIKEKNVHKAQLRGFAYGANIGWISFGDIGDPHVDLTTGRLHGQVWGANVGWISLAGTHVRLRTLSLATGPDTDGDGIPDAWEYRMAGHLGLGQNPDDDSDGDGISDREEYLADTDPEDASSVFKVTLFIAPRIIASGQPAVTDLGWTTRLARQYSVETSSSLLPPWSVLPGTIIGGADGEHVQRFDDASSGHSFYRVRARLPLAPIADE